MLLGVTVAVAVGVAVGVTVAVAVVVGLGLAVAVGVGLGGGPVSTQYLAPVLEKALLPYCPAHTIISVPL